MLVIALIVTTLFIGIAVVLYCLFHILKNNEADRNMQNQFPKIVIQYVPSAEDQAPVNPKLPKPYKYSMPLADTIKLIADYNALADKLEHDGDRQFLQYPSRAKVKPVKYGIRFSCWALANKLGDFGPNRGCTEEEWLAFTKAMTDFLTKHLPGCIPYVEDWERSKPQFRFETYIRYAELPL